MKAPPDLGGESNVGLSLGGRLSSGKFGARKIVSGRVQCLPTVSTGQKRRLSFMDSAFAWVGVETNVVRRGLHLDRLFGTGPLFVDHEMKRPSLSKVGEQ